MNQQTSTYMNNYLKLKAASEGLSNQNEPDVDKIVPLVEQGVQAYEYCIGRINEVEKLLQDIETKSN
ncbi:exodeoxyribonuclease VII small subunit [Vibrio sp. F74]|uniref:exodeoxyribonuclease VII small subunit n=1 Tax=Vibrio sp. F74 TaxID=700020 RepID=UPI0035F5EEF1